MNKKGSADIFTIIVLAIMFVLILIIKVWFFGSLITSSVKAVSGSCGSSYGIEGAVISGNWFCSNEEPKHE